MLLLKQKNAKTSVWPVRITDTLVENFAAASEYLSSSTENCIIIKITQFSYIYQTSDFLPLIMDYKVKKMF